MMRTAYDALDTPYHIFGLGQSNNYVDYYGVGVAFEHTVVDVGVFGRSHAMAMPFPLDAPEQWILRQFLTPSEASFFVLCGILACVLVMASVIGFLVAKERRADIIERKSKSFEST